MNEQEVYSFVYRGILANSAIKRLNHPKRNEKEGPSSVAVRLPFELMDPRLVERARDMAVIYSAIAAFENAVREFVEKRLLEEIGENWWEQCVPEKRRSRAETRRDEEDRIRWHSKRGASLLEYTEIEDLKAIITTQQEVFLPIVQSLEWAKHILDTVERTRNIIMHSGYCEREDVERLGMAMRDWLAQIGG